MITMIDNWLRRFRTAHRDRRLVITVHPELATHISQTRSRVVKNFMWQHWVWLERKANVTDAVSGPVNLSDRA